MENRKTMRALVALVVLALFPAMLLAQNPAKKSLEGVWKIVESVVTGADSSRNSNPQPSLIIFGQTHYSAVGVPGDKPRKLFKGINPTDEEKLSAFDPFIANAGTYEVAGSALTVHPVVAKNPNFMAGGYLKYQFRVDGNTLWLTSKATDLYFRVGDKVVPASTSSGETRLKLVRVE
jgi:hypothetical protein